MADFSVVDLPSVKFDTFNWSQFDYPIDSFKCREGGWFYGPLMFDDESDVTESDMLDYTQFETVYFVRPGCNDGENWTFLIRHRNGYYVFFDAGCDYTGFDCQGGGSITYSRDGEKMWSLGLTDEMRMQLRSNR